MLSPVGVIAEAAAQTQELSFVLGDEVTSFYLPTDGFASEYYECTMIPGPSSLDLDALSEISVSISTFDGELLKVKAGVETLVRVNIGTCSLVPPYTTYPLETELFITEGAPAISSSSGQTGNPIDNFWMSTSISASSSDWLFAGMESRVAPWRSGSFPVDDVCRCRVTFNQTSDTDPRPLVEPLGEVMPFIDIDDDEGTYCGELGGVVLHKGEDDGIGGGVASDGVLHPDERTESRAVCNGADGSSCTVEPTEGGAMIVCSDGTTKFISAGSQGSAGSSCSVEENVDGSATVTCEDGTAATIEPGADGQDGEDGVSCRVDENADGSATIVCEDGTTATIEPGVDGQDGDDGQEGEPGADSGSCTVVETGDGAEISCPDGSSAFVGNGGGCSASGSSRPSGGAVLSMLLLGLLAAHRRRR